MYKYFLVLVVFLASEIIVFSDVNIDNTLLGKSLIDIEKQLGKTTIPAIKIQGGGEMVIFIDHEAEVRATNAKDETLQRLGTQVIMQNGRSIKISPILGRITVDERVLSQTRIAVMYALSEDASEQGVILKQGGKEYRFNASLPSASMAIRGIRLVEENRNGLSVVRISCGLRDILNIIEFTEQSVGRKVAVLVDKKILCVGLVSFIPGQGEIEVVTDYNLGLRDSIIKINDLK